MKDVIFLVDKNSNAFYFAKKIQSYLQDTKKINVPLLEIDINYFKNKEILPQSKQLLRQKEIYFIHDSTKNPLEWWVELLLQKDMILNSSAKSLTFVLPDMFFSRQDRKDKPRVPISARALANSISPGLKRVITMDLHSPAIQGFYPDNVPVDNLYSFLALIPYLMKNDLNFLNNLVVVSPDVGGVTRCNAFLKRLNLMMPKEKSPELTFIYKTRGENREVKEMKLIGSVQGKNILLIDDIIDSGGTLCEAAKILKKNGAEKLIAYGTHGIFSNGTKELLENFDEIITSNTHYFPEQDKNIKVIDVAPTFAEAIYRIQTGGSLSKLFD